MNPEDVLDTIALTTKGIWPIISTTGLISRCLYERHDAPNLFYIPGSMGLASSVALGISIQKPRLPVVAIDGDGSLLMNLGTLVTIAANRPKNFIHVVLDNGMYDSCSGEITLAQKVSITSIAQAAGYPSTCIVETLDDLAVKLKKAVNSGPTFVRVPVRFRARRNYARPTDVEAIKFRFIGFLAHAAENSDPSKGQ